MSYAAMKRGFLLVVEPLLGLGSEQVDKARLEDHNIEAYHLDEHRGVNATKLCRRIEAIPSQEWDGTTVIWFASASSLSPNADTGQPSPWIAPLSRLSRRGRMSMVCIDEAHYVNQHGRDFRPEFHTALSAVKSLVSLSPSAVPVVAMSATMRDEDRSSVQDLLGVDTPTVIHGPLDRFDTLFNVVISGNPYHSIASTLEGYLKAAVIT